MASTACLRCSSSGSAPDWSTSDPADDGVERCAEFMRRGRKEFILQVAGFLGLPPRFFRPVHCRGAFVERQVQLVQVDRRADPADHAAGRLVALGRNARPEPAKVTGRARNLNSAWKMACEFSASCQPAISRSRSSGCTASIQPKPRA